MADGLGREVQVAEAELTLGKLSMRSRVEVTPRGLLAIGALVSGVLLSTSVLVWTATSVARRHPIATRLRRR